MSAQAISCEDINFTAQSDDIASGITATGVECTDAMAFVRLVAQNHNFYSGPLSFALDGYDCVVQTVEDVLPTGHYVCRSGARLVEWDKG